MANYKRRKKKGGIMKIIKYIGVGFLVVLGFKAMKKIKENKAESEALAKAKEEETANPNVSAVAGAVGKIADVVGSFKNN